MDTSTHQFKNGMLQNMFSIVKVGTESNVSDILTKAASAPWIKKHLAKMGFVKVSPSKLHKSVKASEA